MQRRPAMSPAMRCEDVMRRAAPLVTGGASLEHAAALMRDENVGFLPVVDDEERRRLLGVVTDRDLVIQAVAKNLSPRTTAVREVMTGDVVTVAPGDELFEVERAMVNAEVHRLPVVSPAGAVLGVVSLYDLAQREDEALTGALVRETSRPWARS